MKKARDRVILLNDVRGDFPFQATHAPAGVYDAYINPHGAVAVIATNGALLGVKPDEFQWLNSQAPAAQ